MGMKKGFVKVSFKKGILFRFKSSNTRDIETTPVCPVISRDVIGQSERSSAKLNLGPDVDVRFLLCSGAGKHYLMSSAVFSLTIFISLAYNACYSYVNVVGIF